MLTGISGSKIVESVWTISGLSFNVLSGSGAIGARPPPGCDGAGSGASGITGMIRAASEASFCGDDIVFRFQGCPKRVPCQAGALDPHRVLANTREHCELVESSGFDRRIRWRGDHVVKLCEEAVCVADCASLQSIGH